MVNTAVLVSGGGTNLQAIIDAQARGEIKNCALTVISSSLRAYALDRAKLAGLPVYVTDRENYPDRAEFCEAILNKLRELKIDLVVLAGFNFILDAAIVREYPNKIINIHPSLIPSFCGEGYFGLRVHEAALNYGVKVSGATAIFCNEKADAGPVILQRAVEVKSGDTPETLQRRIMEEAEWKILPQAVSLFCEGRLLVQNGIVTILDAEDAHDV